MARSPSDRLYVENGDSRYLPARLACNSCSSRRSAENRLVGTFASDLEASPLRHLRREAVPQLLDASAEGRVLRALKFGIGVQDARCLGLRELDELHVRELRDAQVGQAGLAGAEVLAGAAQPQVFLGQLEAIARRFHDPKALFALRRGVVEEEEAGGLELAAAHSAAELVQLRQSEAVRQFRGRVRRS